MYDNKRVQGKESDVQDVFFKSMVAQVDGTLLIGNERGGRFVVNTLARSVAPSTP